MKRLSFGFLALLALFTIFLVSVPGHAQDAPPPGYDPNAAPPPGYDPNAAPPPGYDPNAAPPPGDPNAGDDQGVSYQTFYDQLGSDGTWVQTDDYGYVFQPNVDDPNWAPYTDGHWVYTDEGWMWVSDEPWGWATYHYGRWADLDGVGWCWVPGFQWAPAWVSWRYGNGYAGWAPLPPDASYRGYGSYHFGGDVDASFHIGANHYNFVRANQLGAANVRSSIMGRSHNASILGRTTNVTNINVGRNFGRSGNAAFAGVSAGGPPIAAINAHATHRVPTVQLTTASAPGRSAVHGNSLAVYAPHVNAATAQQARPASVSRNLGHATISQGTPTQSHSTAASAGQPVTHHHTTTNTSAFQREESAATGEPNPEASPAFHSTQATPQVQQHFTQPTETFHATQPAPQVQQHFTQPAETFHATQPAPQVQHHETQPTEFHASQPPPQMEHHESSPPPSFHASQPAPQIQHASAPPPPQHHDAPKPAPAPPPPGQQKGP